MKNKKLSTSIKTFGIGRQTSWSRPTPKSCLFRLPSSRGIVALRIGICRKSVCISFATSTSISAVALVPSRRWR